MPEPGKTMTPIGKTSSIWSLRLKVQRGRASSSRARSRSGARCGDRPSGRRSSRRLSVTCRASAPCRGVWHEPVELVPDQPVVDEVDPAGEGDLRSIGQKHLCVGAFPGSNVVAAVNHCRRQRAMVDP